MHLKFEPAEYPTLQYLIKPVTEFEQNCSLIYCSGTRKAALIDPGGNVAALSRLLQKHQLSLDMILLTHGHVDHVSAAPELSEMYHVPIIGPHCEDKYWLDLLPQETRMFGMPHTESFEPHRWLEDNDRVTLGLQQLSVIHTPGHTPGHVVFYHQAAKLAFVGDVIFRNSVGRTDFPGGDESALMHSIHQKLFPLGDDVKFIPGHGKSSTFGREKAHNPFLKETFETA